MADNTQLNLGSTGDFIATEDMTTYKLPATKIRTGVHGTDGGDVTTANPFPVLPVNQPAIGTITDGGAAPSTVAFGALQLLYEGTSQWNFARGSNVFTILNNANTGTTLTVWTPPTGKRFRLMGGFLNANMAGNYLFQDGSSSGPNVWLAPLGASGGRPASFDMGQGYLSITANNPLVVTGPAGSILSGSLRGMVE